MPSLHKLTEDFEEAYRQLLESVDEETGEVNQDALNQLNECGADFENKVAGYAEIIRRFEIDVKAYKEEEERLKRKRYVANSTALRLKNALKESMERIGKEKVNTLNYNVRLQKSTPTVNILNIEEIPEEFKSIEQTIKVDKSAIRNAYNCGQVITGIEIINDNHLVIR